LKDRTLLETSSKEEVIYLTDAKNLGGGLPDHAKPFYDARVYAFGPQ